MLNIIDMINDCNILTEDSVLVSFDIVNMFPSIRNVSGLEAVSEILENRETNFPPTECILQALKLCLECNNSVFNEKFFLQEDGTAMGPHMSCSYSDIAMYRFDLKALSHTPKLLCWKRFRDDIFAVWITLQKNFIHSLNLSIALAHLVRSNLRCLQLIAILLQSFWI